MDLSPCKTDNAQSSIHTRSSAKRRVFCSLASACLPGVGHWFLGRKSLAAGFIAAWIAITSLYWPFRLPRFYGALLCLFIGSIALCVFAACNALRVSSDFAAKGPLWWLILLAPVAMMAAAAHNNLMLKASGFQIVHLPSESMEPTISKDDQLVVDLWQYRQSKPHPTQIMTFRRERGFWLKRLIVTGGHTVSGKDGSVFVDGVRLEEPYVQHVGHPLPRMNDFGPIQIPPGKLFVMGDNRDESEDSRMPDFGLIGEDRVGGQALYVLRSQDWHRNGTDLR